MLSQVLEGEEEEETQKPKILNQLTVPQAVIFLTSDDQELINKVFIWGGILLIPFLIGM